MTQRDGVSSVTATIPRLRNPPLEWRRLAGRTRRLARRLGRLAGPLWRLGLRRLGRSRLGGWRLGRSRVGMGMGPGLGMGDEGTVTLPCEERERSTPYGFSSRRDGLAPRGHRRGA